MDFNRIVEKLQNESVQPSSRCWEKLEQQLPAVSTSAASKSISKVVGKKSIASLAGKSAAAIIGAALVASTVIYFSKQDTPIISPNPVLQDNSPIILNDTVTEYTDSIIRIEDSLSNTPITTTKFPQNTTFFAENQILSDTTPPLKNVTRESVSSITENQLLSTEDSENAITETPIKEQIYQNEKTKTENSTQTEVENAIIEAEKETKTEVTSDLFLEIPNVITPNGDGVNDLFVIVGLEECENHLLIIRDKAGKQVLSTRQYHNNWGSDAEEGTYFFQLSYIYHGNPKIRNGIITIIK
ncbi:MAG: gliding motility-associated C-terminal domain-containing protein [Bacteroidales bacterium]|nr:gliding motility-associated C-terminal domain-containing protein [Bacteroidales bacterium]